MLDLWLQIQTVEIDTAYIAALFEEVNEVGNYIMEVLK